MKGPARDPVRDDEADRYAIYSVRAHRGEEKRRRMCETSRDGIGLAILTMDEEGEYDALKDRIGIFDRIDRRWISNPFIKVAGE